MTEHVLPTTTQADEIWAAVLAALKSELKDETFDLWLRPLKPLAFSGGVLTLHVPNRFFSDWIKTHHQARIEEFLGRLLGAPARLDFDTKADVPVLQPGAALAALLARQAEPAPPPSATPQRGVPQTLHIQPKYDFENFIVGPSNRFAEAAAEAVARGPGRIYNPLFIYGGVGLGKTHLLHSIGNEILRNQPDARVMYVASEQFIIEFIAAIRYEKMKDFRAKYRNLDCLLIDDIQFLIGKESSQEEFFYTFNALYDSGKQIVICADRPPKETQVGDRLISRLEWGVIADVQPPSLETRIAILKKKTDQSGLYAPDDVLLFVASHIKSNIRELEGCITRILAFTSLTGEPLTVDAARRILKDVLNSPDHAGPVTPDQIQRVVARHFNMELRDMRSKKRTDAIAFPRQIAMYLTRTLTEMTTPEIGDVFGGKDHTTVIHACNKIKDKLSGDPYFVALLNKITQQIREEGLIPAPAP